MTKENTQAFNKRLLEVQLSLFDDLSHDIDRADKVEFWYDNFGPGLEISKLDAYKILFEFLCTKISLGQEHYTQFMELDFHEPTEFRGYNVLSIQVCKETPDYIIKAMEKEFKKTS